MLSISGSSEFPLHIHSHSTITPDTQTTSIVHSRSSPPSRSVCLRERLSLESHPHQITWQRLMSNIFIVQMTWLFSLRYIASFSFFILRHFTPSVLFISGYITPSLSLFQDKSLSPTLLFTIFISEYITKRILFRCSLLLII